MQNDHHQYTITGTNIEEVKRKNAESGLSYKEVMAYLAKTGGKNTKMFSDTEVEEVKRHIHPN
ncbi:gamma-type small acid-soluble spore protein [Lysinibacillus sp. SGAir0095]|uniref:gamma-type small acid-soluble spore protein n=1 Tax=Lysinibacillus sp. SGAir0095 TaxID=2070463 RepID=UPI0010CCB838|nr:gamma-type small acid-soluble spore protein [Lysinibacillus sp. SGAir0095]QCR33800.1 gamma-type small acid-soluble spore protein [Lysinibacillus sp. SGAir0095]